MTDLVLACSMLVLAAAFILHLVWHQQREQADTERAARMILRELARMADQEAEG